MNRRAGARRPKRACLSPMAPRRPFAHALCLLCAMSSAAAMTLVFSNGRDAVIQHQREEIERYKMMVEDALAQAAIVRKEVAEDKAAAAANATAEARAAADAKPVDAELAAKVAAAEEVAAEANSAAKIAKAEAADAVAQRRFVSLSARGGCF